MELLEERDGPQNVLCEVELSAMDQKTKCSRVRQGEFRGQESLRGQHLSRDLREFPGSPVVRTQCFHCRDPGSIPGRETKIPQAVLCGQKKNPEI